MINFSAAKSPITYKYANHGKKVPTRKSFKFYHIITRPNPLPVITQIYPRYYSTSLNVNKEEAFYEDIDPMKSQILQENKGKSGIYMFTNKITGESYVGQSKNLARRLQSYFNSAYLNLRKSKISRAILIYGYSSFSLTILEYCSISDLTSREQYFFDELKPQYNVTKIARGNKGHSEETKSKISASLKGVYVGANSPNFGRTARAETKALMSLQRTGSGNHLYGKNHSPETIELIRNKALGRKASAEARLKMSSSHGNPVIVYEKNSQAEFEIIGSFVSSRKAAVFLDMGASTVRRYMKSGEIFKNRYKFSSVTNTIKNTSS